MNDRLATVDEQALWTAARDEGSERARDALFRRYLPLARRLAAQHVRNDLANPIEFDDLFQLACAGLLESIDRFRPELGVPFRYFGSRRINGSILNGIAKHSEVTQQASARKRAVRDRLSSLKTPDGSKGQDLDALEQLSEIATGLALGLILEEGRAAWEDKPDPAAGAYETLAWKQMVGLVLKEIDRLPERDRQILTLHYQEGVAFDQIALACGVSKGRVSQLHKAAIALLRKRLLHKGPFRVDG